MASEALERALGTLTVSPYDEMVAYEYLYSLEGSSLRKITKDTVLAGKLPSQVLEERFGALVPPEGIEEVEALVNSKLGSMSVAVNNTTTWPDKLADSERPTPLFYYRGDIGLMDANSISIVGSRKASPEGLARAARLARELAAKGIVVVSGLAKGIDTAALSSALAHDGKAIAVIGTPIDQAYPAENRGLQDEIASRHLLVSQVPFFKYSRQPFETKRYYFPERNELMAAISDATVIVEASDTSGTLTQARACMHQGRRLFIMRSCYEDESVTWPKKWAERANVHILDSTEQLCDTLGFQEESRG